jgi:hypothetical protein
MRIDKDDFVATLQPFISTSSVKVGPTSKQMLAWAKKNHLPDELVELLKTHSPKTGIWAGAGALFDETQIVQWNDDYCEAFTLAGDYWEAKKPSQNEK